MDYHRPVLLLETVKLLDVSPGLTFLDATLGHGGHTLEILRQGGKVFGLDADQTNLALATDRIKAANLSQNFYPIYGNFDRLEEIYRTQIKVPLDGLLFDLGLSSNQQKSTDRGFSFTDTTSLDMRLDPQVQTITAEEIINTFDFDSLYNIFTKYGQEKFSKPLILRIIRQRQHQPIKTAARLAEIIQTYYQEHHLHPRHHPATQVFLALRIYINSELDNLKKVLPLTQEILKPNRPACFITFHSGEDRLVKLYLQQHRQDLLVFKPIRPSNAEISSNPLSRSATLRAFQYVH